MTAPSIRGCREAIGYAAKVLGATADLQTLGYALYVARQRSRTPLTADSLSV